MERIGAFSNRRRIQFGMARIVLIDDSKFAIKLLTRFLESQGHSIVATGRDGDEGFELVKANKPDLVFLDLTMPNASGQECLDRIMDFDAGIKVLILSALEEQSTTESCLASGARGYIQKPMKLQNVDYRAHFLATMGDALAA